MTQPNAPLPQPVPVPAVVEGMTEPQGSPDSPASPASPGSPSSPIAPQEPSVYEPTIIEVPPVDPPVRPEDA